MNDQTIILLVAAGTLAAFGFVAVQLKAHKTRRQHSLGDVYNPESEKKTPPGTSC